jgi:hypothetical protein
MCRNRLVSTSADGNTSWAPVASELAYPIQGFAMKGLNERGPPPNGRPFLKLFFNNLDTEVELAEAITSFRFSHRLRVVDKLDGLVNAVASRMLVIGIRHGTLRGQAVRLLALPSHG